MGKKKKFFPDVIKNLQKRLSWIILVSLESSDKCSYERHTEEIGGGHVKPEAGIGVTQPQAKELLEASDIGRGREWNPL